MPQFTPGPDAGLALPTRRGSRSASRGPGDTGAGGAPRAGGGLDLSCPRSPPSSAPGPGPLLCGRPAAGSPTPRPPAPPPRARHSFHAAQPGGARRPPRPGRFPAPRLAPSSPRSPTALRSPCLAPAHPPTPLLPADSPLSPRGRVYAELSFLPFFGMFPRGEAGLGRGGAGGGREPGRGGPPPAETASHRPQSRVLGSGAWSAGAGLCSLSPGDGVRGGGWRVGEREWRTASDG